MRWVILWDISCPTRLHYVDHFNNHQEKRMAETSSTTAGAQTLLRGLAVLNAVYNVP